LRDLDRSRSLWTARGELGDGAVIRHAGRSLGHCCGKRKAQG
jgi:hypothetical protein